MVHWIYVVQVYTPWYLRILFVNFSAQSSLSTSRVGYKSSSFSTSSQLLSLSVASHWWSGVITASQFKQLDTFDGTGVKIRGAGEGRPFIQGEMGEGEFSRRVGLLRISFSGDSVSLSPTWMSFLILCAKGERLEGEGALGESGKGRFLAIWMLTGKAESACRH